jgi:spore coat protein A, manganese oxidase
MNKTIIKVKYILGIFSFLFILLINQNAFAQLAPVANPLFTQLVADALAIPKFVNPLPIVPRLDFTAGGTTNMYMGVGTHDFGLLPGTLLNATVWGYNNNPAAFGYLGPTIVAKENQQLNVQWHNNLGNSYPLPLDETLHWAFAGHMGMPPMYDITTDGIPAVPHLHGGNTESASDGLPEAWWSSITGVTGMDFVKTLYTYDNNQEAATIWYHDHALGITRLNVYMGLAAFYFLRDDNELNMIANNQLPSGAYEIELAIQDKMFYPDGQLAYPDAPWLSVPGFTTWAGGPSVQPEFFGDVIVVNGKAWPILDVEPRKYRFRILNGSDSRFYNLRLAAPVNTNQPFQWTIIGSDQGFLNSPLSQRELLIAPGERYDVVIDFSDPALLGQTIIIRNNAKTPFPNGATVNPNTTGQIMAFRVGTTPVVDPVVLPATLRPQPVPTLTPTNTRRLVLFEGMDEFGRMQPMLGTIDPTNPNPDLDGTLMWSDPKTEFPFLNSTEIWEMYNATPDAHPMHIHLVQFQILGRQKFTATVLPKENMAHDGSMSMGGKLTNISLRGKENKPGLYEAGWKDTGIMYPGERTRVIAKFEREGEYVWHCHILSHEDHEMMRRFEVIPQTLPKNETGDVLASISNFELEQNYPNPFNPTTNIRFSVAEDGFVSLKVFDVLGREVKNLLNQDVAAGRYDISFDASDLTSGTYIYQLSADNRIESKKMLLMK